MSARVGSVTWEPEGFDANEYFAGADRPRGYEHYYERVKREASKLTDYERDMAQLAPWNTGLK